MRVLGLSAIGAVAATRTGVSVGVTARANPIRKVVNLLQGLRKEVEAEGEGARKAFDKAMCFCETNEFKTTTVEIECEIVFANFLLNSRVSDILESAKGKCERR